MSINVPDSEFNFQNVVLPQPMEQSLTINDNMNTIELNYNKNKCLARLKSNLNKQCSKTKKYPSDFCGTHLKGIPHGCVNIELNLTQSTIKKEVWVQDIGGIMYYLDNENNVYKPEDIVETIEELIKNDITTGEGDRANLKEATSDNPSLKHFTRNHKLIRKANENRAVAKNKIDEQFKGFVDENNKG